MTPQRIVDHLDGQLLELCLPYLESSYHLGGEELWTSGPEAVLCQLSLCCVWGL